MGERSNTPDRRNISLLPVRQMGITKNMLVSRLPDAYRVVATTEGIGLRPYPRLLLSLRSLVIRTPLCLKTFTDTNKNQTIKTKSKGRVLQAKHDLLSILS